jgi:hypothetical protein
MVFLVKNCISWLDYMTEFTSINPDDYPNLEENDELALFELFLMDEN